MLLTKLFANKKAFVGYLTAGDGGVDYCIEASLALAQGGVDILELGIPFSDPIADGPVIQAAMRRALSSGTTTQSLLKIAKGIRKHSSMPLIAFSYYNPILQAGPKYLCELKEAGFDGILIVDLPHEEAQESIEMVLKAELCPILIATPSTTLSRIETIASLSKGFIYYACQKGTTGFRKALPEDFEKKISEIKSVTKTPIAAGFGIKDKETAEKVLSHADGFVIGSAFVDQVANGISPELLQKFAKNLTPKTFDRESIKS